MSNPCFTYASSLLSLEPKIGLVQYVVLVFSVHHVHWHAAAIHNNNGNTNQLLEFDELTLGTM